MNLVILGTLIFVKFILQNLNNFPKFWLISSSMKRALSVSNFQKKIWLETLFRRGGGGRISLCVSSSLLGPQGPQVGGP